MHLFYAGYNKETGTDGQTGHSMPVLIRLKKDSSGYSVIEYKEPQNVYIFHLQ
ncbi:hypothetical protein LC087_07020 [Bacillus carboniphilus]|uniref:Uncharacterized protein n=1 Tax=Bacillus carboniphilus TaxID=86663 RepID=A0ABY9JWV4_9BACI|nr:hypothetical protein [Bacillus carboniphilus]WLR43866.1 hypothetical protein LC087_07020 [Bacillus carboniphilus]